MRLCIVNPYHSGSHAHWAEGLQRHLGGMPGVELELLTTPGRHWKWRMHGAAVPLARQFSERYNKGVPELIICTDMMDAALFRSLLSPAARSVPVAVYFHENQLTFPSGQSEPPPDWDRHYAFMNIASALSADAVWFNSAYHRAAFLQAVPKYISSMPDLKMTVELAEFREKSAVLPLGVSGAQIRACESARLEGAPIVVWNHRWERDKNPETFFATLEQLMDEGLEFRLSVLGQSFKRTPEIFAHARERFADRIHTWGFAESREVYLSRLWEAHVLFVTSHHDFFGLSVVEGACCGLHVVAPDDLAYAEHFRDADGATYQCADLVGRDNLKAALRAAIESAGDDSAGVRSVENAVLEKYDWPRVAQFYFEAAESIIASRSAGQRVGRLD